MYSEMYITCLHTCVHGQEADGQQELHLARQLIGNIDEVTDLRLLGPPAAPEQLAVATNSPVIRLFDTQSLSCTATLAGHTDTVLVLDATRSKGEDFIGQPPP